VSEGCSSLKRDGRTKADIVIPAMKLENSRRFIAESLLLGLSGLDDKHIL
jgi:hypothetical protein